MKKIIFFIIALLLTLGLAWRLSKPKVYPPEPIPLSQKIFKEGKASQESHTIEKLPNKTDLLIEGMILSVQSDSLCKAITAVPESDYLKLIRLFSKLNMVPVEWEESMGAESPLLGQVAEHYHSEAAQFFSALLLSNQFVGLNFAKVNYGKARSILRELTKAHPENAAYPFFLLPIEEKMKVPESELIALAKQCAASSIFNTHIADLGHAIYEAGWKNATLNFLSQIVLSSLPMPDVGGANISFMKLARRLQMTAEIHSVAVLLMKQGIEAKASYHQWGYLRSEYSLGRNLAQRGDVKVHPSPEPKFPELPVELSYRAQNPEDSPILEMNGCEDENLFRTWFANARSNIR